MNSMRLLYDEDALEAFIKSAEECEGPNRNDLLQAAAILREVLAEQKIDRRADEKIRENLESEEWKAYSRALDIRRETSQEVMKEEEGECYEDNVFDLHFRTSDETYAILLCKSGVKYTAQVHGCACSHPVEEGILVPVHLDLKRLDQLLLNRGPGLNNFRTPFGEDGMTELKNILKFTEIGSFNIELDEDRQSLSGEAWLYVKVLNCPFAIHAVLVWHNSD